MESLAERIIDQFLEWECLGRGSLPSLKHLVTPEPPYRSFLGYRAPGSSIADDGRKASFFERFLGEGKVADEEEESDDLSFRFAEELPSVEICAHLPQRYSPDENAFRSFLLSISGCRHPLSFEVFGNYESIQIQIVTVACDSDLVMSQATLWFPEAYFTERIGQLEKTLEGSNADVVGMVECELTRPLHVPIQPNQSGLLDGLVGALSDLSPNEVGLFQVLFEPARHGWAEDILNTCIIDGEPFFSDGEALARAARMKVSQPLYGATFRFGAAASNEAQLDSLIGKLTAPLGMIPSPDGNDLSIVEFDDGFHFDLRLMTERCSRRFGMLLNLNELTEFIGFPKTHHTPKLVANEIRSRPAPALSPTTAHLNLGTVSHRGEEQDVILNTDERVRHTHIIGASGTGKSTLLLNCIRQDMENGQGVAVLDPHGDLIETLLKRVPEHRIEDVILFDPSDEQYPIGFNILDAHSEVEKTLLASDLCSIFRRFSTSWGDQMTAVLSNAILAFLESSQGGTLADLRRFLVEKPFRESFLETVQDPEVIYFWRNDYKLLSGRPEGSIVTRLNSFLRPKLIRHMVSQKTNKVDFAEVMDEGKILLAKIPQGLIGEENAHLLGSLLVTKLHQLVIGRQARDADSRRPFFLYIDEFPNFITSSMASILSGARKYNLGLSLAHQDMRQLESRDRDVASAVLSNAHNRIVFRVGNQDAKILEEGFGHYSREDIQNLKTGQAIGRIGSADQDFCMQVPWAEQHNDESSNDRANRIIELSRSKYGVPIETLSVVQPLEPPKTPEPKAEQPVIEKRKPEQTKKSPPQILPLEPSPKPLPQPIEKSPSSPGRGGREHKALQKLVKQMGHAFDYRAAIEKSLPSGQSVDVLLEKGEEIIAVEISVTSPLDYELENIRKCLEISGAEVAWLCPDDKKRQKMSKLLKTELKAKELKRIHVLPPDKLQELLQKHSKGKTKTTISKGYAVNVSYVSDDTTRREEHRAQVGKALAVAQERLQKGSVGRD